MKQAELLFAAVLEGGGKVRMPHTVWKLTYDASP